MSSTLAQEIGGAMTLANVALNLAVQTYAPATLTTGASAPVASAPIAESQ
ncbi:hypothetical protein AB4Y32_12340 [Paraburkholderia phymatum]|uniref:Uncharacterized protein n=1 Tax=Paraburkholderia phymatum TaxID=148447 RepID=A0ACC6TZ18_9BURK